MKNERIDTIVKELINNKETPTPKNISMQSLFSAGGTIDEAEAGEHLKEFYFSFDTGNVYFAESTQSCFIGSKEFKIVSNYEWTYKVLKTRIKSAGGFEGFKEFLKDNVKLGDTFYFTIKHMINKVTKAI